MAARLRFAKFRGLRSWRSSPWDPKESLPPEYARIYAFQSMRRAEKKYAFQDLNRSRLDRDVGQERGGRGGCMLAIVVVCM